MKKLLFFLCLSSLIACAQDQEKLKGLSFVGSRNLPSDEDWEKISQVGANSVTLMPYAYSKSGDSNLISSTSWQWRGESFSGTDSIIAHAKKLGLRVILKPHLWIMDGEYTGKMTFPNKESRFAWNKQYISYIVRFAALADKHELAIFCLGNEMESLWTESPEDFEKLIKECRKVYSGKLVYAANWDEYHKFPYWNLLDYIGVNAYFPLKNKDLAADHWATINKDLAQFSEKIGRKIIFTELGYRSIENPFKEPWVSDTPEAESQEMQALAWEIFFENAWNQDYLLGVFVWKWFPNFSGDRRKHGFTPQHKLAEKTIAKHFKR